MLACKVLLLMREMHCGYLYGILPSMLLQRKEKHFSPDGIDDLGFVKALPVLHDVLDDIVAVLVLKRNTRLPTLQERNTTTACTVPL